VTRSAGFEELIEKEGREYRVLSPPLSNMGMSIGSFDIGGYDATILRRYAELMFYAAGQNPDKAGERVTFLMFSKNPLIERLYEMLRCRFIFYPSAKGTELITVKRPLKRLNLLTDRRVLTGRDIIFEAMSDPSFDPSRRVILESEPGWRPTGGVPVGELRIVNESTDHITVEGEIDRPAILLVTDAYHPGWRAEALAGSVQSRYEVLPANYALRAVPLKAGTHRFRMEYRSPFFEAGVWISAVGAIVYIGLWALLWGKSKKGKVNPSTGFDRLTTGALRTGR